MMLINPYAFGGGAAATYLDQLATTPRCALSLKKLISTATVAIRVRRSSDNAEQDIGFSGDALDVTALASFVSSDSAYITKFYDQTGNGFDAVQSTSASQPRIVNAGVYDGIAIFDGSDDSMSIPSLTQGAAQFGIYLKSQIPTPATTTILLEQSANYNSNAQSCVVYLDTPGGPHLWTSCRNTTGGADFRAQLYGLTFGALKQHTILFDRSLTGTDEEKVFEAGAALGATPNGAPADQTGVFSTYDLYIASRGGASLFTAWQTHTLVFYNADTSGIQASIEAIVA